VVDGHDWTPRKDYCQQVDPGASWVGRGTDLLHMTCDANHVVYPNKETGRHTVWIEVTLPGTELRWESEQLPVSLSCPGR